MSGRFAHDLPWGAQFVDGTARFRLWAPAQSELALFVPATSRTLPMTRTEDGWFELTTDAVALDGAYQFQLQDGMRVPDPAARAQIADVHGPSRLVDPRGYDWHSSDWRGRRWEEAVIYELHTGTFSPDGTFEGVIDQLDRLVDTGITAVELLPVAQFAGNRGWGYDGVLLYAPHIAYGGPERLKALVDACHQRGLMILLDVVYNHFGPDGTYLSAYAPDFFHQERHTPWGPAIAFDRKPVRDFYIHNALYWLDEFRFDGLRFDAIDQIEDQSEEPILAELARRVRRDLPDRHIHLTSEDDKNSTALLKFDNKNQPKLFTAEWNDDWHHAMHHLLTGEDDGFYEDYVDRPAGRIAKILAEGFDYQGEPSSYRGGRNRGEPSAHLPPTAFIDFLQNHDQTGNRPFGERMVALADEEAVEAALSLLLLSPHIPLLFMGEEYGEDSPFQYFTDFHGELADAVRNGRRQEFSKVRAFNDPDARNRIPDPNALQTFQTSQLDRCAGDRAAHQQRSAFIRNLLRIRADKIVPELAQISPHAGKVEAEAGRAFTVSWRLPNRGRLILSANLEAAEAAIPAASDGTLLFERPAGAAAALAKGNLPPWSVVCRIKEKALGVSGD